MLGVHVIHVMLRITVLVMHGMYQPYRYYFLIRLQGPNMSHIRQCLDAKY